MPKLNPYLRIMRAAKRGEGVRLSPQEVYFMSFDSAIAQVAQNILDGEEVGNGFYVATKEGFTEKG